MQPDARGVQGADVAAEREKLDAGLALFDVSVEPVSRDVVGGDQVPDAVWAVVGCADPAGLARGAQL